MRIWHYFECTILGHPLVSTGRALSKFPFVVEQDLKVLAVPTCGVNCPCTFKTTGDGVNTLAATHRVAPTETLLLNRRTLRLATDIHIWIAGAVHLAECVSTSSQRKGFFVVHCHAGKRFTNVSR